MAGRTKIRNGSLILILVLLTGLLCGTAAAYAQFNDLYLGTGAGNPGVSTGNRNTALGEFALSSNTSGSDNTAVGSDACMANTIGGANTGVGSFALIANTNGTANTAVGASSMSSNTNGAGDTALGGSSLALNTSGSNNTAIGFDALFANSTGGNNTALGSNALVGISTGSGNIGVGLSAGKFITSGSNNIDIGNVAPGNESNTIRIGNTQTATFLAGVNGATATSGVAVFVDANGQLGTLTSSRRFKEDIADMGEASQGLMQLRPVTFHYKAAYDDGSHLLQYGLIAEEVAKVYPDLVQVDDQGQPFTVRYHAVNALLLNEVQKQHGTIATQEAEMKELRSLLAAQKEQLAAQDARLQKLEAKMGRTAETPKAP
jgi:hypothetical protein